MDETPEVKIDKSKPSLDKEIGEVLKTGFTLL